MTDPAEEAHVTQREFERERGTVGGRMDRVEKRLDTLIFLVIGNLTGTGASLLATFWPG